MNYGCAVDGINNCITVIGNKNKLRGDVTTDSSDAFDDGAASVGVVSDGGKNGRNIRGGIGALIAARVLKKILFDISCIYPDFEAVTEDGEGFKGYVVGRLTEEWHSALLDHAAEHPFTEDEYIRMGVSALTVGRFDSAKAYACSVCAVLVCGDYSLTVQLGDGCIVKLTDNGESTVVPKENGKSRASLGSPDAQTEMKVTVERLDGDVSFAAVTNGLRSAFANDEVMTRTLAEHLYVFKTFGSRDGVSAAASSLAEAAHRSPTGDDVSAAYVFTSTYRREKRLII